MPDLRRSTIAAGLTLILVAGLAACGANNDDAAPADNAPSASASPSVSQVADSSATPSPASSAASPSPSTSPSPSGPYEPATPKHPARNVPVPGPLPEVAKEKSKAGQVAFIEHWVKEFNYGLETNKLRPEFWDITSKSCAYCHAVHRVVEMMAADKSWNRGGELEARNIQPDLKKLDNGLYEVRLTFIQTPRERYFPGKPKPAEQFSGATVEGAFLELSWANDQWRLEGLYLNEG